MSLDPRKDEFDVWRDKVVLGLAGLAALGSIFGFITVLPSFSDPSTAAVFQAGQAVSDLFFAILYILLGLWPHRYVGIWEIAIFHRIAVWVVGLWLILNGAGAILQGVLLDFGISIVLIAAYAFAEGYRSWRSPSQDFKE